MNTKSLLINDGQVLKGASNSEGSIPVFDDGHGPLFLHRNSLGVTAIIRTDEWNSAYEYVEEFFLPSAEDSEVEAFEKEFGGDYLSNACWNEQFGSRPNGGFYKKDLNGDTLMLLTAALVTSMGITLEIDGEEEDGGTLIAVTNPKGEVVSAEVVPTSEVPCDWMCPGDGWNRHDVPMTLAIRAQILVDLLREVRSHIDVSLIRTSAKANEKWTALAIKLDAELANHKA